MNNNKYKVQIAYYYKNRLKEVVKSDIKKYLNIKNLTEIGIQDDYWNKDIKQILADYFEYTNRLSVFKKGQKVVLNSLLKNNEKYLKFVDIIDEIKKELEEGISIHYRLTKFFKNYFFKDDQYRHYNIHHLHLTKEGEERNDHLLLVYFDNEKIAHFLSIVDHETFKNKEEIERLLLDAGFRDILPNREYLEKLLLDKIQIINEDSNNNKVIGSFLVDTLTFATNDNASPLKNTIKPFMFDTISRSTNLIYIIENYIEFLKTSLEFHNDIIKKAEITSSSLIEVDIVVTDLHSLDIDGNFKIDIKKVVPI